MSAGIDKTVHNLQKQLGRLHCRANAIMVRKQNVSSWRHRYLVESLIQETWQVWNDFSKRVINISCKGYACPDGTVITPCRLSDHTPERIAHVFKKGDLSNGLITQHYYEPTWGDISKFVRAVSVLQPSNETILLQSFGLNNLNQSILDLKSVRNCLAHKSRGTFGDYKSLFSRHRVPDSNVRPHDFVWLLNNDREIVYFKWLDDILQIATLANRSTP